MEQNKEESWFEDVPKTERCLDPGHNPPSHMVYPSDKIYHHICPTCKKETIVQPSGISW